MATVGAMMEPGSSEWPRPGECRTSWTMSHPRPAPMAKVLDGNPRRSGTDFPLGASPSPRGLWQGVSDEPAVEGQAHPVLRLRRNGVIA
jgi:hypothetical protein